MQKPPLANVFGHWEKIYEDFQTSSLDYYAKLQTGIERRKIPGARVSRVDFREGDHFSAKRTYLRVERGEVRVDICASPFGTGFFFSSWLLRKEPRRWPLLLALALLLLSLTYRFNLFPPEIRVVLYNMGIGRLLFFLAYKGKFILPLFILAWLIWQWTRRITYYTIDTMSMFQGVVHAAVLEQIDGLTKEQGLRALTENERQPVLRQLLCE